MYFFPLAVFVFFSSPDFFCCNFHPFQHLSILNRLQKLESDGEPSLERELAEIERSSICRPLSFLNESYFFLYQSAVEEALERIKQQKGVEGGVTKSLSAACFPGDAVLPPPPVHQSLNAQLHLDMSSATAKGSCYVVRLS